MLSVLGLAAATFGSCLAAHVLLWRLRVPTYGAALLVVIFLLLPGLGFAAGAWRYVGSWPLGGTETALAFLLHGSLSLAYISSYPAARSLSPTLAILLQVGREGPLTEEEIEGRCQPARTMPEKSDVLRIYGLVKLAGGGYRLTAVGRATVGLFARYRALLGLPPGEG